MSVWESKTLGDLERESDGTIQTGPFGSQLHMSDYSDTGTPVVMPTNIRDLRIDTTGIARVGDEHVERLARHKLRAGDIIYSRRGDVEKCALITENEEGWLCGTGCLLVRVQGPNLDARFLSYLLSRPETRAWISQHAVGATMPNLNTEILREVPVDVPDVKTQHAIAATLGALDDKIESNRRATAVGESLIRALVESALDASEGADGTLGDYCGLVKAPVKVEEISADDNYIGLEHMPRGSIFLTEWENAEGLGSNKTAFHRGDVLFGKLRPYFKKVGIAPVNGVCSTDILAVRPNDPRDLALIAVIAASDALIDSLSAGSTGTRMPRASWKDLAAWQVPVLTPTERAELSERVAPLIERLEQLTFESRRLAALRDALLPELLSGRMDVLAEGVAA